MHILNIRLSPLREFVYPRFVYDATQTWAGYNEQLRRWQKERNYSERKWMTERRSKPIVYFSLKGETVMENLVNRRARPYDEFKEHMGPVLEKMGLPADTKVRWSQKAGCSCGCSPGFFVETYLLAGLSVFVDYTYDSDLAAQTLVEAA